MPAGGGPPAGPQQKKLHPVPSWEQFRVRPDYEHLYRFKLRRLPTVEEGVVVEEEVVTAPSTRHSRAVTVVRTVTSVNGSQANSRPVRIGGNVFNVQTGVEGGTLAIIEVSNDKARWVVDTSGLGNAMTVVTTRPKWARGAVASDGSAPRENHFWFTILA